MPNSHSEIESWVNTRLKGRVPELDGIRGLAILMVLLWHGIFDIAPAYPPDSWMADAYLPFRLLWTGVDLFFVLSGFLIGGILYDARQATNYYRVFYTRRFFRILPPYLVWYALFLLGLVLIRPGSSVVLTGIFNREIPPWSYAVFLQNVWMSVKQVFGPSWMGPTWSLAVEEQFYLILPLVIRRLSLRRLVVLVSACICIAPLLRLELVRAGNAHLGPYTLLPCRMDAFGLGVLAALACRQQPIWEWLRSHKLILYSAIGLLAIKFAKITLNPKWVFASGMTWVALLYALVLLAAVLHPEGVFGKIFRQRVLIWLGGISYGIYLIHHGILYLAHYLISGKMPAASNWTEIGITVVAIAVVLVIAVMSWRWFESPLVRRGHQRARYEFKIEQPAKVHSVA